MFCQLFLPHTVVKWIGDMSKTPRETKRAVRPQAVAEANSSQANNTVSAMLADEEDELPLVWQKMSNKLLQSFNEQFDKFE